MSCECTPKKTRNYYRYYDTPDGCDVFKKILVTSRYGAITGLIFSTYDVLMYSHAVGLKPMMRRYAYHMVPLTLVGATFAAVANGVQHWRNKDDSLNYFIGGLSCGPILVYYFGSYHALVVGGILLGIAGKVKKDAIDSGNVLFPEVTGNMGSVNSWRNDYTLVPDPKDTIHHTCNKKLNTNPQWRSMLGNGGFHYPVCLVAVDSRSFTFQQSVV